MEPKKFFIADLHFGHKNILTLANRKFNSIEDHDQYLLECINKTVSADDHLYILGDIGFHKNIESLRETLNKINTRHIHVVKGNHDRLSDLVQLRREGVIEDVKEYLKVQKGRDTIVCFHYPIREWEGFYRGWYHAYGHCHSTVPPYERSMDVGVDSIGCDPIEFDDFIETVNSLPRNNPSKTTNEDKRINETFPDLSTHYFVGLCTGNEKIRETIKEVLTEWKLGSPEKTCYWCREQGECWLNVPDSVPKCTGKCSNYSSRLT